MTEEEKKQEFEKWQNRNINWLHFQISIGKIGEIIERAFIEAINIGFSYGIKTKVNTTTISDAPLMIEELKQKYMKTNLNDYIKVKLTLKGVDVIREKYGIEYPIQVDDEGYVKFQIWDFARIFGDYMNMCDSLVCETNIMVQVKE